MGDGSYNFSYRTSRADASGYKDSTVSNDDIFKQNREQQIHPDMVIYGKIRESRDSAEHPYSIPIIISLDVTGSMSTIPRMFIADGLPDIVSKIINAGIEHPQICFSAIGDHEYDRAPFQVGQFESSDELMDKWLQSVWLERGGGGNDGESYALAWKFAADHTACDHIEKRGKKGILFSIGDEPNLRSYPRGVLNALFGGQNIDETDITLYEKAKKNWDLFHISIEHGTRTSPSWRQLFGDNLIVVNDYHQIPEIISSKILELNKDTINNSQPAQTTVDTIPVDTSDTFKITL